jgi:hypothetical protein
VSEVKRRQEPEEIKLVLMQSQFVLIKAKDESLAAFFLK